MPSSFRLAAASAALGVALLSAGAHGQVPGTVTPAAPDVAPAAPAPAAPQPQTAAPAATAPAYAGPSAELAPGITFQVTQLKRMADKGVTELRFAVSNATQADTSLNDLGLAYPYGLRDIYLVDFAGRKQYDIGHAAKCLCSTFKNSEGGVVRAGERREFWAWYPLLPANAQQVAIQLEDQPPVMNVPVTQQ